MGVCKDKDNQWLRGINGGTNRSILVLQMIKILRRIAWPNENVINEKLSLIIFFVKV